jgi:membrane protein implicated in regulation of membrane protease activity
MNTIGNIESWLKNSVYGVFFLSVLASIISVILISLINKFLKKYFLKIIKYLRGKYLYNLGYKTGKLDATLDYINLPIIYCRFLIFETSKVIFLSVLQIICFIILVIIFYMHDVFTLRIIILAFNLTMLFFLIKALMNNYLNFEHSKNSYIQEIQENEILHNNHISGMYDLFQEEDLEGKDETLK